jgi:hypothetical protein
LQIFKTIVTKIFLGFFIGMGFGLALGVVLHYSYKSGIKDIFDAAHDTSKYKNIAIENLNEVVRDGKMYILGSLKNNNSEALYVVSVQADFYDKNVFVEQCSTNIKGNLKPQEERNFKISCDSTVQHDRNKVYLLNNARR